MKWSIISISTATALTFGGLVVQNQKTLNTTKTNSKNVSSQEEYLSSNEKWQQDDENESFNKQDYDDDSDENISQNSQEQGAPWGQDQVQPAPSGGFNQGSGSSGASR